MEVVSWRVRLAGPTPELALGVSPNGEPAPVVADARRAMKGERPAYFPELDGFVSTPVYDRYLLEPGAEFQGPAIVEERESTVVVGPRALARVDHVLNLILELAG